MEEMGRFPSSLTETTEVRSTGHINVRNLVRVEGCAEQGIGGGWSWGTAPHRRPDKGTWKKRCLGRGLR